MFRVENIKNNNDLVVFLKIIEKKYIKNFQEQGQVYFSLLKEYRKNEEEGQQDIGDSFEASLTELIQIYIGSNDLGWEEIHGYKAGNNIRIDAKQCAFCCYCLGLKCFDKESETKFVHRIPIRLLESFCKDKGGIENCAIMIFDDLFIHRVMDEIKRRNLFYMSKKVSYDNYQYVPQFDIHSKEYLLECCFHKRSKYEYQNEFRIAVLNTKDEPITDLNVNVESDQLQFLELKNDHDFVCEVDVDAHEIGKVCDVQFDICCYLDKNNSAMYHPK